MRETLEFMAIRTIKRKEEEKGGRVKKGRMGSSFMCFIVYLSTGTPREEGLPQGMCLWPEGLYILLFWSFRVLILVLEKVPLLVPFSRKALWEGRPESPRMPHSGFLAKLQAPPPGCFA